MKNLYFVVLIALTFVSCERKIDFIPENQEPKLVVEGIIEQNEHPTVVLTNSLDFFSRITKETLANSFVRGAEITISDGSTSEMLIEYEVPIDDDTLLYYYSVDTTNGRVGIRGENGKEYQLTIRSQGKEYTAVTTVPVPAKTLDSLYFYEGTKPEDSNKVVLYGRFNDPQGFGNYIRYFTNVNSGLYLPGLASVYDDQVVDGTKYNIQIEKGVNRNQEIDFESYAYFSKGDIISVKFCNIDKAVFDFWRTMEYSYSSIGNPFSSPTKVIGNISNGALGYFGGYSVQYESIIIPE